MVISIGSILITGIGTYNVVSEICRPYQRFPDVLSSIKWMLSYLAKGDTCRYALSLLLLAPWSPLLYDSNHDTQKMTSSTPRGGV